MSLAEVLEDSLSAVILTRHTLLEPEVALRVVYDKPPEWGTLHEWQAFGSGFGRETDGSGWWVFSLFYSDTEAADADQPELLDRVRGYTSAIALPGADPPFDSCGEFTSEVRKLPSGSILTGLHNTTG